MTWRFLQEPDAAACRRRGNADNTEAARGLSTIPGLGGGAIFGVGWGLSGLCPGPAIAGLASGLAPIAAFAASMIAGMALYRPWNRRGGG